MDVIAGLLFLAITYIAFAKIPTPAVLLSWAFTGVLMMLSLLGVVNFSWVYLMYIVTFLMAAISAAYEKNT